MQIYLSLMSQKNPSSDSSSYDLSSPQGRMLYVRETTNAAFSSWTSPLQRQDPDTQEEKKQEMLSRIMGKLKSGKKLLPKNWIFCGVPIQFCMPTPYASNEWRRL